MPPISIECCTSSAGYMKPYEKSSFGYSFPTLLAWCWARFPLPRSVGWMARRQGPQICGRLGCSCKSQVATQRNATQRRFPFGPPFHSCKKSQPDVQFVPSLTDTKIQCSLAGKHTFQTREQAEPRKASDSMVNPRVNKAYTCVFGVSRKQHFVKPPCLNAM